MQDCTQLLILRSFVEKSQPQRSFALYDFPLLLRFSLLPKRASELCKPCKKFRKIGTTTVLCNVLFLLLIGFSRFLEGANSAKMAKSTCRTIFLYCFVLFPLTREGLQIQLIPPKVPKLFLFPTFLFFLTSSSLTRTTDVNFITLVLTSTLKRSFTRIKYCNCVDISTGHWTHNACFNIAPFLNLLFLQLAIYSTAITNRISLIPKSKATTRD